MASIVSVLRSDMLFADYLVHWLEIAKVRIKVAAFSSYSMMIKKIIAPYFMEKNIRLCDLEAWPIQQFYTEQLKRVKANTVIHYHANIHDALEYVVKIELIQSSPADKVDRPKKNDFMPSFYDAADMQKLFAAVKGHKLELPVLVAAFYGMRRGEVPGLKWDAIDFEQGTITVKRTVTSVNIDGKITVIEQNFAKTKSNLRTLPLVSQFSEYFAATKETQKQIQEWLGHSDFSTTANFYAHLEYQSKMNSAEAMKHGVNLSIITTETP